MRLFATSPHRPFVSFNSFNWIDVREKNAASHAEKKADKISSTVKIRI